MKIWARIFAISALSRWVRIAPLSVVMLFAMTAKAELFRTVGTGLSAPTLSSGYTAANETIREPGSSAILGGLDFNEVVDRPCFIRMHWWRYTHYNVPQEFTTDFNICGRAVDGDKSLIFANARDTKTGVRAIQVCTTGSANHRLKGAKIYGGFVDSNNSGTVTPTALERVFERTNCQQPWKPVRICDPGKVAVGLAVQHSKDEITGLALRCAAVSINPVEIKDNPAATYDAMERDIQVQVDKNGRKSTMSITAAIAQHEVAGATVVIIDNGAVAVTRHYGMRNAKDNLPTNANTVYQAASISKLFGALAMTKAARASAGPKLDDTAKNTAGKFPVSLVSRWVDKKFNGDQASYPAEITVRRLMGHSAGLSNWGIGNSRRDNPTDLETILIGDPFTDSTKPRVRPGMDWCYSGGGISAAEAMLEAHTHRTAKSFLNDMIKEYGLTKSTFDDAADSMTNLARGCSKGLCSTKPKHTIAKFAGGMLANPQEYAQVLTLLMNWGKDQTGRQIIPLEDVQAIMTPTHHRSSSMAVCTRSCAAGETCILGMCRKPLDASCDGVDTWWYGMGTRLSKNNLSDGYAQKFYHGGANPDGDSATEFKVDRQTKRGYVIMVNGEYEWSKGGVTYGASALVTDIAEAFSRHF